MNYYQTPPSLPFTKGEEFKFPPFCKGMVRVGLERFKERKYYEI
jgi:hypothetical protein